MMRPPVLMGALSTGGVLLLLAWILPGLLGLDGTTLWILRGGLGVLALGITGIVWRILRLRTRRSAPREADPRGRQVDERLAEANRQLVQSGGSGRKLSRVPTVLVLGPRDAAKTTSVLRSGLSPDLLAGEATRDDVVVPTEGVNVWYADGVAFVEAGGGLMEDPPLWRRLVEGLRPARLGAALFRARQAPRVALLCVPADLFLRQGASREAEALGKRLRERLTEAAGILGVHLPVYVLFTRTDRVPSFDEFVRTLDHEEAGEVVGATLPFAHHSSSAEFARDEARRISGALGEIVRGLARKRLDVLAREGDESVRQVAWEFPREVGKLEESIRTFLMEVGRPSHMGPAPFVRGFYLSGVRAVWVEDTEDRHPTRAAPVERDLSEAGATGVFRAMGSGGDSAPAPEASPRSGGGRRKVPQWTFLPNVFRHVLLGDSAAMGATASGSRVSLVRRSALAAVCVVALLFLTGATISFFQNRSLSAEVASAAAAVEALPTEAAEDGPSLAQLEQLEALGSQVDRLRGWQEGSPPLRLRWGLYNGNSLLDPARQLWADRFRSVLWEDTRAGLLAFLRALPESPDEDSDYEESYNALKAHLMTTDHPEEGDPGFLAPVLLVHLSRVHPDVDPEVDPERGELASLQFQRFARELAVGPPWTESADRELVGSVRDFMGEFAARDRFYQSLVSAVSADLGRIEVTGTGPGVRSSLREELSVPGAFSREGWTVVHDILSDPEALLVSEEWVVGEQVVTPEEREELARDLEERYRAEYLSRWQEVLSTGGVRTFASVSQAADVLHTLAGNDSPIWRILEATNRHTRVDDDEIRAAFQPVHHLLPLEDPDDEDSRADPSTVRDYLDDLMAVQSALDQLDGASGDRMAQGVVQAEREASQVRNTIARLARDFERSGTARVSGDNVERLLEEPVRFTSRLLDGFEAAQAAGGINAAGADFCRRWEDGIRGFPFQAGASSDADVDEVKALLTPGESRLHTLHEDILDDLVTRQGGRWEARSGASPAPTSAFLSFYNHAHRLSDVLFESDGSGPRLDFFLRMEATGSVPRLDVRIDGQSQTFTQTQAPTRDFSWEAERSSSALVEAEVDGRTVTVAEGSGPWSLFHLMAAARNWEDLGGGTHRVTWDVPGADATVSAELTLGTTGTPPLRSGGLSGPGCTPEIVR
ncbi:MAG: hypothetical protein EA352_04210 [Gemmatimonadales bacterium]|nr:MAG: hypothetical protein EA352_04210 [Gemmatimonadales bacterium]